MVYILFNQDKIFGIYGTMTLLQANCYIFTYQLFSQGRITKEIYFKIKNELSEIAIDTLPDLEKIMLPSGINIESHNLEANGFYALKSITEHIESRFSELEEIMGKDSRITITIPGNSALDNMMVTAEIENIWREMDSENYLEIITKLKKSIIKKISQLQMMFEGRVQFGNVSDRQASHISYQVWPADIGNWNLPNNSIMFGDGFAACFQYQVPGVFGIVTNPYYGYLFN